MSEKMYTIVGLIPSYDGDRYTRFGHVVFAETVAEAIGKSLEDDPNLLVAAVLDGRQKFVDSGTYSTDEF